MRKVQKRHTTQNAHTNKRMPRMPKPLVDTRMTTQNIPSVMCEHCNQKAQTFIQVKHYPHNNGKPYFYEAFIENNAVMCINCLKNLMNKTTKQKVLDTLEQATKDFIITKKRWWQKCVNKKIKE